MKRLFSLLLIISFMVVAPMSLDAKSKRYKSKKSVHRTSKSKRSKKKRRAKRRKKRIKRGLASLGNKVDFENYRIEGQNRQAATLEFFSRIAGKKKSRVVKRKHFMNEIKDSL